jgi:hypothetical protein
MHMSFQFVLFQIAAGVVLECAAAHSGTVPAIE